MRNVNERRVSEAWKTGGGGWGGGGWIAWSSQEQGVGREAAMKWLANGQAALGPMG